MKNTCCTMLFFVFAITTSYGQDSMEKTVEKRAREMFRVIGLSDKAQWTSFVKNNYSQSLIDKPMRERREKNGEAREQAPGSAKTPEARIEEKAMMFARLHEDFGSSKLTSLTTTGDSCDMTLETPDGLIAAIHLKVNQESPYLLLVFGVDARK